MDQYDYIIVGAGSAGCVLADLLSRDGKQRIAVLEAGGSDRRIWIKLPIGYGRTFFDQRVNWKYEADPDEACMSRKGYWPRGKVIGGSSSINALVYCRGQPGDFDDWREAGATGWGWDDVRPHFERIERRVAADGQCLGDGPQWVSDVSLRAHPTNRYFLGAAREMGLPMSDDFNGDQPEGVGYYWITTRGGLRWSAADAFLRPAIARRNVTLLTGAVVERLLVENRQAKGVTFTRKGRRLTLHARREVILSAGAIGSPQLLQLSGIGPGELLQRCGVDVVLDNAKVGSGLQDHIAVSYYYKATERTLNDELSPWWGKLRASLTYALGRRGPLSLSVNQCGGFVRSSSMARRANLQLYFTPTTYTTAPSGKRPLINPDPFSAFLISFQPTRPTSRGRIDITAPEVAVAPRIRTNYLSTEQDLSDVVAGGRLLQSLVRTAALRKLIREAMPPNLDELDDEGLIEDFRARCGTVFHPVSTCAMGRDEKTSVVAPDLRVHGIAGLRVVDASVFPNITSGNTNAPTLMVAHKAASEILQAAR